MRELLLLAAWISAGGLLVLVLACVFGVAREIAEVWDDDAV